FLDISPLHQVPADCTAEQGHQSERAVIEGQQIVVPVAVRVRSQISCPLNRTDDADIGVLAGVGIDDEESIGLCINAGDYLVPAPLPAGLWVSKLRNVFVRALRMRFGDASHLD